LKSNKPVIGLIGGIGAGKSEAAAAFARRGARVVSGDALAHAALRRPEVRDAVARRWGPAMIDDKGEIVRKKLGAVVFADEVERQALEAIVHPWIKERIRADVDAARADPAVPLIVLDAAIMLEAGWDGVCNRLVFVDAPPDVRRQRVAAQRGWTDADMAAREAAQLPLTAKAAHADHTLDNSASPAHLDRQVDDLLRQWGLAPAPKETSNP
jgi:dephospho-CoA kinase